MVWSIIDASLLLGCGYKAQVREKRKEREREREREYVRECVKRE